MDLARANETAFALLRCHLVLAPLRLDCLN